MQAKPRHSILIAILGLKIAIDMVSNELTIYNATTCNSSFLATKNSGLVTITMTSFRTLGDQ